MIQVGSVLDIRKLFVKRLGSGEESMVGLLPDGKHVAKAFHSPCSMYEKNRLLIGSELDQSSIAFLQDLYYYGSFIFGGIAEFVEGKNLDSKVIDKEYINLTFSVLLLRNDIKTISDDKIEVGDIKPFNMKYTDDYIKIVDTGRFTYSNEGKEEIYRRNLEMVFTAIRMMYNNPILENIFKEQPELYNAFMNNENLPEFFRKLGIYTSKKLGEPVKSFGEYIRKSSIK